MDLLAGIQVLWDFVGEVQPAGVAVDIWFDGEQQVGEFGGVFLLLLGIYEELLGDRTRMNSRRHEVMKDAPTRPFLLLPPRGLRCISRQYVRLDPEEEAEGKGGL